MSVPCGTITGMSPPDDRCERARELRRAGLTLAQIKTELGLRSNSQLVRWLQGIPAPAWTKLRWLELLGVDPLRLRFSVHIHDSADVTGAERYWADVVGMPSDSFRKTVLKRHTPRTNRKNTGQNYHGCLQIYVRTSARLYRRMEGLWRGVVEGSDPRHRAPPLTPRR
jgi:hypothetical protein